MIRVCAELQLFLTMVCNVMLRLDLHQEWISNTSIIGILLVANFVMTPVPFVYDAAVRCKELLTDIRKIKQDFKKNGSAVSVWDLLNAVDAFATGDDGEEQEEDPTEATTTSDVNPLSASLL